ncbi:MAG: DUF3352 domain-containing protein [Actinomycetales bacterium]
MSDTWGTPAPPPGQGQPEILTNAATGTILAAELPPSRGLGKGKLVAIGAGVVAVAGIGIGAALAAGALGGGGAQPDSFVPASAAAYASVDLDPSLGQKVDALRFLRKFPSARSSLGSTDDIRQWFFDQVTKDDPHLSKLSYDRDVKPWIGDRFAVAAVPSSTGGQPNAVVVLQVNDESKAKAGLAKLMSKPDDGVCSVSSGYAVCAENRAVLNAVRAEAAKHSLAGNSTYRSDVSSVGKRGIAVAWGDLGKLSSMVPSAASSPFGGMAGGVGGVTSGRFVASIRFTGDDVELVGTTRGGLTTVKPGPGGTGVETLPAGTVAAIGGSLDPHAIDQAYAKFRSQAQPAGGFDLAGAMEEQLASLGIHLPKDLDALLGTKFQIAFGGFGPGGAPQVGLHSNAPAGPAARVLDTLSSQLSQYGVPFALRHVAARDGYAVALDERYAKQLASGGRLGDEAAFKRAVPDAASAQSVGYLDFGNLQKALRAFGSSDSTDADLKALLAAGFSVRTGSDGTATVRATLITR